MKPVIMFDFDGVVADSFQVFYTEFAGAVRELGYTKLNSEEALLKLFEGNVIAQLVKQGFPVWRLKKLADQFGPRIAEANKRVDPFPGMPELVSELAASAPLYVITSNSTGAVESFAEKHGITGVRDVLGADKESSKVKKIKQVRKLHPELHPWYVGDTKGDMIEGRQAGATTVAVGWGWHPVETLETGKPDHIVHTQDELRALLAG
jgi:phosphoglycolate phosphatase